MDSALGVGSFWMFGQNIGTSFKGGTNLAIFRMLKKLWKIDIKNVIYS